MKDRIRSFLVFTTLGYRILAFVVVPVLGIWSGHLLAKKLMLPGYLMTAYLLVPIEIMLDHFVFGGICAKGVSHLEYLKCSKKGEWVVHNALVGGMVRILLTMLMVFLGNQISLQILYPDAGYSYNAVLVPIALLLSSFAVIMLGATIGRFFDSMPIYYLLATAGAALETAMMYLVEKHVYLGFALSAVLAVGMGILSEKIGMRHIKESYHDKTVTDGI